MKADIKKTKNNQQFSGKGNKKKNKKKTATCGRIYCSPLLWKKIYKDIKGSPFLCFTWYSLTLFVILPCYTGNYCAHGICVSVRLGRWNTLSQAEGPLLIYYQEGKKGSMAGFLPFFLSDNSLLRFGDRDGKENDPFPPSFIVISSPISGLRKLCGKRRRKKGGINAEHVI